MHETVTGEKFFCAVNNVLGQYKLSLNKLLCVITDGRLGLTGTTTLSENECKPRYQNSMF
jgi:hypothetical protein